MEEIFISFSLMLIPTLDLWSFFLCDIMSCLLFFKKKWNIDGKWSSQIMQLEWGKKCPYTPLLSLEELGVKVCEGHFFLRSSVILSYEDNGAEFVTHAHEIKIYKSLFKTLNWLIQGAEVAFASQ